MPKDFLIVQLRKDYLNKRKIIYNGEPISPRRILNVSNINLKEDNNYQWDLSLFRFERDGSVAISTGTYTCEQLKKERKIEQLPGFRKNPISKEVLEELVKKLS